MMSYLRMYRDKFVESNDLEYIYMNQSLKFVDYMEQIGLRDKIVEIGSQQLKDSVSFYHGKSLIQTVNTMNNHLNAIKKFLFIFIKKELLIIFLIKLQIMMLLGMRLLQRTI